MEGQQHEIQTQPLSSEREASDTSREYDKLKLLVAGVRLRSRLKKSEYGIHLGRADIEDGDIESAKAIVEQINADFLPHLDLSESGGIGLLASLSILENDLQLTDKANTHLSMCLERLPQRDNTLGTIAIISKAAIAQGRLEDLIAQTLLVSDHYRDWSFCRMGEEVAKNDTNMACEILSKINRESEGGRLTIAIVSKLVADGQHERAEEIIAIYKERYQKEKLPLKTLVKLDSLVGNTDETEKALTSLEYWARQPNYNRGTLASLNSFAETLIDVGNVDRAGAMAVELESCIEAILSDEESDDSDKIHARLAINTVANLYTMTGDYKKAEELYFREKYHFYSPKLDLAEKIIASGDLPRGLKIVQRVISDISDKEGYITGIAEPEAIRACEILANNGGLSEVVDHIINLGEIAGSGRYYYKLRHFFRENWPIKEDRLVRFDLLQSKLVENGHTNWDLLRQIGLVVNAESVNEVLTLLPLGDKERALTIMQDEAVRYGTKYAEESRRQIFDRTKALLVEEFQKSTGLPNDRETVKSLMEIIVNLGGKEARDLIYELGSQYVLKDSQPQRTSVSLRLLQSMANLNTNRGNDFLFGVLGDDRYRYHESMYLLNKLVKNNYIDSGVVKWIAQQDKPQEGMKIVKMLISRTGVNPSKEILDWITTSDGSTQGNTLELVEKKLAKINSSRIEIEKATTPEDLIAKLVQDKDRAMAYYILNNGKTRFDLINNYSFEKFWEILNLTQQLSVNDSPLKEFTAALESAGFKETDRKMIIANLVVGRHPFYSEAQASMEAVVRLDVTDSDRYLSAVSEIGNVFGKDQVGVCLKSVHYRRYLKEDTSEDSVRLIQELDATSNLPERQAVMERIEASHPDFLKMISNELRGEWTNLERKMAFGGVSVDDLLSNSSNQVNAEAVISKIEEKRGELKLAKRSILSALKNENPRITSINREIGRKRKAVDGLKKGLGANPTLITQIETIEQDIKALTTQVSEIGLSALEARYSGLTKAERDELINKETEELTALTDKDPSAVLMYLVMELAGENNLIENDVAVIRETASHLEGPMQMVVDLAKLDRQTSGQRVEKLVKVRMLDKKDDLMTMVRFADSKICCFSSSNYQMRVAHNTENKYWVSSINKDPLSFVFEIEDASGGEASSGSKKNLGFVFGMFGVDEDNKPVVMLNGVYYSGGNDITTVTNIANTIESALSQRIGASHQIISSMYGGRTDGKLSGYSAKPIRVKRLRAIDNGRGGPETYIYDDLGTTINTWTEVGGHVWHKELPKHEIENLDIAKKLADEALKKQAGQQGEPAIEGVQARRSFSTRVKERLRRLFRRN